MDYSGNDKGQGHELRPLAPHPWPGEAARRPAERIQVPASKTTRTELVAELHRLRRRIAELETALGASFFETHESGPCRERRAAMSHRIVVADGHELFRCGLRALLENRDGLAVVGEVRDGREAVRSACELRPDLVMMAVELPGLNGIEATRQIASEVFEVKVLCLARHDSPRFVEAAFEAGAAGYLLKDSAEEELVRAIRTVLSSRPYVSPAIADAAAFALRRHVSPALASAFTILTEREREVLQLLAEGCSTREIASRICISPKTVYTHREHMMEKLGIHSVAGLTRYAIEEGLTSIALPRPQGESRTTQ